MKLSLFILFFLTAASSFGQADRTLPLPAQTYVYDYFLPLSDQHTTTIIFPHDVVSVDRGTQGVLARTLEEVRNIVKVKAAGADINMTSLTVITNAGEVYTFRAVYEAVPSVITINMGQIALKRDGSPAKAKSHPDFEENAKTAYRKTAYYGTIPESTDTLQNLMNLEYGEVKMSGHAIEILSHAAMGDLKKNNIRINCTAGSALELKHIFIHGDVLFYRFDLRNESQIPYDIDFWRFFIRDQKATKRTAVQERDVDMIGVYTTAENNRIEGHQTESYVVALRKFTIPDKKRLYLEVFERNGGRHHQIRLKNRHILRAQRFSPDRLTAGLDK